MTSAIAKIKYCINIKYLLLVCTRIEFTNIIVDQLQLAASSPTANDEVNLAVSPNELCLIVKFMLLYRWHSKLVMGTGCIPTFPKAILQLFPPFPKEWRNREKVLLIRKAE